MQKTFTFLVFITFSTFVYSQKKSWTIYSPAMSNVIGKSFAGKDPLDAKVLNNNEGVTFETVKGATTFSEEYKRSATFGLNTIFNKQSIRIFDINAYGIKVDLITLDALYHDIDPGVNFVYGGLRADSVTIIIRRSKKSELNAGEIITQLKKVFPVIETNPVVSELTNFLKFKTESQDSTDFNLTIKDSSVYFLVQVATFDQVGKTYDVNWNRVCASYLNVNNKYADTITLLNETGNRNFKTGITTPKFSNLKKGAQAQTWLQINEDNTQLLFNYKTNYSAKTKSITLPSTNEVWNESSHFVFRYPYSNTRDNISFKDILLTIDAVKRGDKIVITSGATKKRCGATYLNYPESKLTWIEFKQ